MKREYRRKTLKYRIFALLILSAIVIDLSICIVCGYAYSESMKKEFIRINDSIVNTIANSIDEDDIKLWISGEKNDEYQLFSDKLESTKRSALDVESIQIYKMNDNNMTAIIDNDQGFMGEAVAYPDAFLSIRNKLREGERIESFFLPDEGGLISLSPIECDTDAVYVISKINVEGMKSGRNEFMLNIFYVTAVASVLLVLVASFFMNHILIEPLNKIDINLRKFAEDNTKGEEIKKSLTKIKDYNIKEITRIKEDFVVLCDEVGIKTNEIKEFDEKLIERMKSTLKDYE